MSVYIFNIFFIVFSLYATDILHFSKKVFLKISLMYLFLISSLRNQVIGHDYANYIKAFQQIKSMGVYQSTWEKGFTALNRIIGYFFCDYIWLAVGVNIMLFIPLYFYIYKYVEEKYWWMAVLVFALNPYMYIQSTFNILRQTCATGVILIGAAVLVSNYRWINWLLYFLIVALAGQFHRSAFVMIVVPFVLLINWKPFYWLLACLISIVIRIIGLTSVMRFFSSIFHYSYAYGTYEASSLDHPIYVLLVLVLILYIILRYNSLTKECSLSKTFIDLYLFSLCILILAVSNAMIYRVYIMFSYVSLPGMFKLFRKHSHAYMEIQLVDERVILRVLYVMYYLLFYFGYIIHLYMSNDINYIPFQFAEK